MAKVTFTDFLGRYGTIENLYTPGSTWLPIQNEKANSATYRDETSGENIVLRGSGLTYNLHEITGGTIEKIVFRTADNEVMITVDGLDLKARQLGALLGDGTTFRPFVDKIFSGDDVFTGSESRDYLASGMGNDRIFGGKGADYLDGGRGNDRLNGGVGSDHFSFGKFYDRDVVVDFDAVGGGRKQDYINAQFDDLVSKKQVGDDVVLDFGNGDTLTLLGVNRADVTRADFDAAL
jgi:Ca2+-binding RTX toxin-like protein